MDRLIRPHVGPNHGEPHACYHLRQLRRGSRECVQFRNNIRLLSSSHDAVADAVVVVAQHRDAAKVWSVASWRHTIHEAVAAGLPGPIPAAVRSVLWPCRTEAVDGAP